MIGSVLSAPWFWWAVGIVLGLPVLLIMLTEWQQALRRRNSALVRPVSLLRNLLVPLAALLAVMVGASQIPTTATPVRIVSTLVGIVVLILMLSSLKASLFENAPDSSWRRRIPSIFVDVVRFAMIAVGVALIFSYVWGAHIGGLFTALGIGSIVVGLTLQNSVGQIISGLLMLFEQPFKIGDWIETPTTKGRVVEVNWRAVHLKNVDGLQVIPNSVLAGQAFTNSSRPVGQHSIAVTTVFSAEDRPDLVCAVLARVAAGLPECNPDRTPSSFPMSTADSSPFATKYRTRIPLRSPLDGSDAEATFLRWIWYTARREGLHLDEADDTFHDPELVVESLHSLVAPVLRLTPEQEREMISHSTIERYGAGEQVQVAGTVPDGVSFIISGSLLLTADVEDGTRAEIDTIDTGSFFGQSTLIRHPIPGSSFAIDELTVIRVDRDAIERVVKENPVLLQEFGRAIDERRAAVLRAMAEGTD